MVNKIDIEYIFKYITYIKYIFNKMLIEDNTFIDLTNTLNNNNNNNNNNNINNINNINNRRKFKYFKNIKSNIKIFFKDLLQLIFPLLIIIGIICMIYLAILHFYKS